MLVEALAKNSGVKHLVLDSNNITDKGATDIAKYLQNNTVLEARTRSPTLPFTFLPSILSHLALCALPQVLYLGGNQISDEGAKALAKALTKNSTLQLLSLADNIISTES